ncbi:MAG: hypothetical protein LBR69_03055 [Endomicrobium sp.]|jgi:hypothetical protein|nr:hypothetical protein [Endomicrobium sp.]
MNKIIFPDRFRPRDYQIPLMKAIDGGCRRAVQVWPRRHGKDLTDWNIVGKEALKGVGNYYYTFPTYAQGKKALWDGKDKAGFPFLEYIPRGIWAKKNETELKLTLKNGSIIQIIGTENIDSVVGSNPKGIVFSEYSLQNPLGWDYLRPILAENGGWAIFNFTARGENHAYDIHKLAKYDPNWFHQLLTVDDTGAIPKEVLDQERREIIFKYGNDALFRQEYYNDFTVPIAGAYYAEQISRAYAEGRITKVQHDQQFTVWTWWDLGIADYMFVLFGQVIGQSVRLIDCLEVSGMSLAEVIQKVKSKPYVYEDYKHFAPHDITVRELSDGKRRIDTAYNLGIKFSTIPKLPVADGIDMARNIWPKVWIDAENCKPLLNAVKSYHKKYDEKKKIYLNEPYHDWSSHGADTFRGMSVSLQPSDFGRLNRIKDDYGRGRGSGWSQTFNPATV